MQKLEIQVSYDEALGMYYASSKDIQGLHVESTSLRELKEIVEDLLPDFLEPAQEETHVPFELLASIQGQARLSTR